MAAAGSTGGRAKSARNAAFSKGARLWVLALALCPVALAGSPAQAESAWVRGGLRLNLRTEPGTQYRILGVLKTGDGVQVLKRTDEWTQVRTSSGERGWIPKGYLQAKAPPAIRLEQIEVELASLRAKLEASEATAEKLAVQNDELSARDAGQQSDIAGLTADNAALRKGRRWPEWVTGASVLAAGMLLGGVLHRNATRRSGTRIRL